MSTTQYQSKSKAICHFGIELFAHIVRYTGIFGAGAKIQARVAYSACGGEHTWLPWLLALESDQMPIGARLAK